MRDTIQDAMPDAAQGAILGAMSGAMQSAAGDTMRDDARDAGHAVARPVFPFAAIVGQDDLKLALLLAAVDPSLGGVLALGDRGTGKSTAVRALAALLPGIDVVAGCPYNADPQAGGCAAECPACGDAALRTAVRRPVPVVDLPLGATEDRVVGALDLEQALVHGRKRFEPGLLARANRGFLYIDEVNLLEDHLVDLLLDVAASGENVVEREGMSVRHAARFVLVGSGNDLSHPSKQYRAAVDDTIRAVRKARPDLRVVIVGLSWIHDGPIGPDYLRANRLLADAAKRHGVSFIDPNRSGWYSAPRDHSIVGADHRHPTDEGHALIAEHMTPVLEGLARKGKCA